MLGKRLNKLRLTVLFDESKSVNARRGLGWLTFGPQLIIIICASAFAPICCPSFRFLAPPMSIFALRLVLACVALDGNCALEVRESALVR